MTKATATETMENILGAEVPETIVKASEKQLKFYADLCVQKNTTFNESITAKDAVDAEIKKLMAMPFWKPVHAIVNGFAEDGGQVLAIRSLCETLKMNEPDYTKLNGNFGGSASQLITMLKKKSEGIVRMITEKQLVIVKEMQFCADISETIAEPEKMSLSDASEYIKKHSEVYYAWKNTRPTDKQIAIVQELTKENGDELALAAIMQFTRESVSEYISQLYAERKDKTLVATTLEPEIKLAEHKDMLDELYEVMNNMYASIGQAMEEEEYQKVTWASLKDLVDLIKLFGVNAEGFFERTEHFTPEQIAYLVA